MPLCRITLANELSSGWDAEYICAMSFITSTFRKGVGVSGDRSISEWETPFFFWRQKCPWAGHWIPRGFVRTVRTAAVLAHRPHTELNMKTDVSGRIRKTEPRPSGQIDVKQQRDINWHFNLDLKRKQLKPKLGTFYLFMCSSTEDCDDERLVWCFLIDWPVQTNLIAMSSSNHTRPV